MPLKKYKPTSPARRFLTGYTFEEITRKYPEKSLLEPMKEKAGRNNNGRITMRRRGGGHKRRYRVIDFRREKYGIPGKVFSIEYDPNRTARIALIHYADGEKRYIVAPMGLEVGTVILSGETADIKPGNALPLKNIPMGTVVHNVELRPGKGAQLARSAGAGVQVMAREGGYALLKLPSGEIRKVREEGYAVIGQVGNDEHSNISIGKAGRNRHLGLRPKVRGKSMNPIDHPMGGGEGATSGGRHPCSPWGQKSKGLKTRKRKKTSNRYIVSRRRK